MIEKIFGRIEETSLFSLFFPYAQSTLYAQAEFERFSAELEILTSDKENSKKLADDIKKKAVLFSGMSTYSYMDMFSVLAFEAKRRLAYGVPISEAIQRIEQVNVIEDLFSLQIERMTGKQPALGGA